jgi:hypothetical protein
MALAEKHRSIIYAHFVETIGEEAAEAMLSQYPTRDLDEPVTKEFVRAEIADVQREIAVLRGEMRTEFAAVRGEMKDLTHHLAVRLQVTVGVVVGVVGGLLALLTVFTR